MGATESAIDQGDVARMALVQRRAVVWLVSIHP